MKVKDISIVVQGPVLGEGITKRCLDSIRSHFAGAEVILSTWEGEGTKGLPYDILIENEDPGAQTCHERLPLLNNVNRQIVSTREGLKRATRPYAIKVRSDILFTGTGFLEFFGKYSARCAEWSFLRERVINCSVFAQNPRRHFPFPYHPSDWFFFGLRDDVLAIWDIPLASEQEISHWYDNRSRPVVDLFPHLQSRYCPEQYVWISYLRKHLDVDIDYIWDCSNYKIEQTETIFANNLIFLEPDRIGIRSLKHHLKLDEWAGVYSFGEWERLYRKHCDSAYRCAIDPAILLKEIYYRLRFVLPVGILNRILRTALASDRLILAKWEHRSPRTFRLASSLFRKLT
jgi:hypothetical protein